MTPGQQDTIAAIQEARSGLKTGQQQPIVYEPNEIGTVIGNEDKVFVTLPIGTDPEFYMYVLRLCNSLGFNLTQRTEGAAHYISFTPR